MPLPGFTLTEFYGIRFRPGRAKDPECPAVPYAPLRLLDSGGLAAMDGYLAGLGYEGDDLTWLCYASPDIYWALAVTGSVREPGAGPYPENAVNQWAGSLARAAFILGVQTARMDQYRMHCLRSEATAT